MKTRLWRVWDLPESSDVIRRHTWTARHGSCRGCIKHMNPTKGNAICKWNSCWSEWACCCFKIAWETHRTRLTENNMRTLYCFSLSPRLSACLGSISGQRYGEEGKNRVFSGSHVSPKVHPAVAKVTGGWTDFVFKYSASHIFWGEHGGAGGWAEDKQRDRLGMNARSPGY